METDTPRPAPNLGIAAEISDAQSHLAIDRARLASVVRRTLTLEGVEAASISLAVVDDATIRAINARHLGHDWPTDVISFPLSEPGEAELSGELVISAEMAVATARGVGADPFDELALYVVHGLLHLCGHDDRTAEDAASMRVREAEVLEALGLANTFALADGVGPDVGPGPVDGASKSGREVVRCKR